LYERTGQTRWLDRAQRAGDDLVRGQQTDGHYRNSGFEQNPLVGGTPHEAAADVGLLLLARTLREARSDCWHRYLAAAERNLRCFYIEQLWSQTERRFRDGKRQQSFVPNKSATLIEALCLLADLTGREEYLERFVRPTADAILEHQVHSPTSSLNGAIAQNSLGQGIVRKYFPYYNARCVPGLLAAYEHLGDRRYLSAALDAMGFVFRWRDPDGAFPQVIYENGSVNRYPRWVAGLGDILRAADAVRDFGFAAPIQDTLSFLLKRQLSSGAFATAHGFASQVSQRDPGQVVDGRDLLPVVGWNDKAFRYLTGLVDVLPDPEVTEFHVAIDCQWLGHPGILHEDREQLWISTLARPTSRAYYWRKSTDWAVLWPL
jgi:hypothetical protein